MIHMDFKKFTFLFLVLFTVVLCTSDAYTFNVGGRDGWTLNPSQNYNRWAERMRFLINDALHFKYRNGSDSVLVVNKDDYDNCNTGNPIMKMDTGDSTFKFDRSGPFYFISGNKSSCDQGQKLIIIVLAERNNQTTPPSSPTPSPTVSPPSPSGSPTPAPAISPASPTPAPAISPVSPTPAPAISPVSPPSPAVSPTPAPAISPVSPTPAPAISPVSPTPAPATSPESPPSPTSISPAPTTASSPGSNPLTPGRTPADVNAPAPARSSARPAAFMAPSTVSLVMTIGFALGGLLY